MLQKVEGCAITLVTCSPNDLHLSCFNVVLNMLQLLILITPTLWRSKVIDLRMNKKKISALTHATCYRNASSAPIPGINVVLNTL